MKGLLPITCGCTRSFRVSIQAKIPAWFRVLNEHTQGVSKTTVLPNLKQEHLQYDSSQHSYSANNTPTDSPSASPVSLKRSSQNNYSLSKESNLVDSLNLDHPALNTPRSSASLPNFKRSPGHQRNTSVGGSGGGGTLRRKNRGSKKIPADSELFDSKRASMVSIRSDPGDEIKSASKLTHKDSSKAINIPKIFSRAPHSNNSPNLFGETSSSYQSTALHRTGSGNKLSTSRKQQSTPLTKGLISVPVGPLIREKHQPPSRKTLESEFKIEYSGGGGYQDGYCRQCFTKIQIVVKPCLVFEEFEIIPNER